MFLKESRRFEDGKEHRYWSLVRNRRVDGGRKVMQRHVLYPGEIKCEMSHLHYAPSAIVVTLVP